MVFFEWCEQYSVGDDEIDEQHQNLFSFLNEYYDAMLKGRGKDVVDEIFAEMKAYAVYHFKSEEQKMAQVGYPDLEQHKKVHASFVGRIKELEEKKAAGDLLAAVNVAKFLNKWLVEHILGDDKKYSPYMAND